VRHIKLKWNESRQKSGQYLKLFTIQKYSLVLQHVQFPKLLDSPGSG